MIYEIRLLLKKKTAYQELTEITISNSIIPITNKNYFKYKSKTSGPELVAQPGSDHQVHQRKSSQRSVTSCGRRAVAGRPDRGRDLLTTGGPERLVKNLSCYHSEAFCSYFETVHQASTFFFSFFSIQRSGHKKMRLNSKHLVWYSLVVIAVTKTGKLKIDDILT